MKKRALRLSALLTAMAGLLVFAPAALAGTIRYTVTEDPAYTIQDNGQGIVKVTYNGCVTAGARQTLGFQIRTNVSNDSNATFSVLREEGQNPTASFEPPSVFLRQGPEQTFDVVLSFSIPDANNGVTSFRIKLDPETGEGLGQGAGVMVRIPCVIPAGASFPSPTGTRSAPCISITPVRVRAGERARIRTTVTANGQRIQNSVVRVSGGGVSERQRTNSRGVARFDVRARREGVIYVQANTCAGADRIRVLGVRQSGSGVLPVNTG
jgi:hypothetical protein